MTHDKESAAVLTDRPALAGYSGLSNRLDFIVFIPAIIAQPADIARVFCRFLALILLDLQLQKR